MVNQLRVLKITLSKLGDNTGAVCLVDIGGVNLTPKPYSKTPPPHKPRNLYLIFSGQECFWIGLFWVSLAPLKIQVFLNSISSSLSLECGGAATRWCKFDGVSTFPQSQSSQNIKIERLKGIIEILLTVNRRFQCFNNHLGVK